MGMRFSLDRNVFGNWQTQAYGSRSPGLSENTIEIEAINGEEYSGTQISTTRDDAEGNPVVIDGGETYRFYIAADVTALWEIESEFQAFDPECHDGGSG